MGSLNAQMYSTSRFVGRGMARARRSEKALGSRSDLKLVEPNFFLFFKCLDKLGGSG